MAALTMTGQAPTFSHVGDLALGEGTVAPITGACSVEVIGNDLIVAKLKQLVDLCDEIGWGALAWCDSGARQREAAAGATAQPHMGSDLNMLAQNGHVFDEKCEDLLSLTVDDCRISPELRQVTGESFDPAPRVSAQLFLGAGSEAGELLFDCRQLGQTPIPLRLEAGRDQSVRRSTSMKRRRARSLS